MTHIERNKTFYIVSVIFVLFISMALPHIVNNNFWAPDADRISMDGIFLLDFIKDLPGSALHPYEYTTFYYAKYPALSIGYRPPLFPSYRKPFLFLVWFVLYKRKDGSSLFSSFRDGFLVQTCAGNA